MWGKSCCSVTVSLRSRALLLGVHPVCAPARIPAHNMRWSMQKCGGERAGGFVATEFQEWFRLRALPKIKECVRQNFTAHNHPPWCKQSHNESMCGKIGHHIDGSDPLFFIAQDSDPRHSMRYFWQSIDSEEEKPKHKPECNAKRKATPTPPPLLYQMVSRVTSRLACCSTLFPLPQRCQMLYSSP